MTIDMSGLPELCVCLHMKQEHGGKLANFFKGLPGGKSLAIKLAAARLSNPNMPRPKEVHCCLVCSCEQYNQRRDDN